MSFTRQGRCQERDDVLGTTKPPLSLAWIAGVLRADGHAVRVADLTAEPAARDLAEFAPTLIIFAS